MGAGVLIGNGILKLWCCGMAQGAGFVGGLFFPLFYLGVTSGVLFNMAFPPSKVQACLDSEMITALTHSKPLCFYRDDYDGINLYWGALLMMSAVPASVAPMPFTLTILAALQMEMSGAQATSIFIAVLVSMLTVTGTGIIGKMTGPGKSAAENEEAVSCHAEGIAKGGPEVTSESAVTAAVHTVSV